MDDYWIAKPVNTFYVAASSYPGGVRQAWEALFTQRDLKQEGRVYYGICLPGTPGEILYLAASSELFAGEAAIYGLPTYTIPGGQYLVHRLAGLPHQRYEIAFAFDAMCCRSDIISTSPCIEWYLSEKETLCMVRKKRKPLHK